MLALFFLFITSKIIGLLQQKQKKCNLINNIHFCFHLGLFSIKCNRTVIHVIVCLKNNVDLKKDQWKIFFCSSLTYFDIITQHCTHICFAFLYFLAKCTSSEKHLITPPGNGNRPKATLNFLFCFYLIFFYYTTCALNARH